MEYNFTSPIVRDTVNGGNTLGDSVSIRFRTDNPGPWILHWYVSGIVFLLYCSACLPVTLTSTSKSKHRLNYSIHAFDPTLRGLALVFAEAPEAIGGPQDSCPGMYRESTPVND